MSRPTLPASSTQPPKRRTLGLLALALWSSMILTTAAIAIMLASGGTVAPAGWAIALALPALLLLLRAGYERASAWLLVLSTLATAVHLTASGLGYGTGAITLLFVTVSLAGLLLPRNGALAITACSVAYVVILAAVGAPPPDFGPADQHLALWLASILELAVVGSLSAFAADGLRQQNAMREASDRRYQDLVSRSNDAIVVVGHDGLIRHANPAALELLGVRDEAEIWGQSFRESGFAVPDELDAGFSDVTRGDRVLGRASMRRRDGSERWVQTISSLVDLGNGRMGVQLTLRDITEQVDAERTREDLAGQLVEAQRLESVGRLAGGVAHDFNNQLTVILTNAAMLASDRPGIEAVRKELAADVMSAGQRASVLTKHLLAFARRQRMEPRRLELPHVLDELAPLLRRLLGNHVQLEIDLDADLPAIVADRSQLEQVLVSLAANARDAIEQQGVVTIRAAAVHCIGDAKRGIEEGHYVRIEVSDTGRGMSAETLKHAFEPFFTTRASDGGTGLGLATVHGIVTQSHGHVAAVSEPGRGTRIIVHLPVSGAEELPPTPIPDDLPTTSRPGRILVVDDDELVRTTAKRILEQAGHVVVVVATGAEALAIWRRDDRFALLLSDVVMPEMSGGELVERVRAFRPESPLLLMTGYSDDELGGELPADITVVRKPFTPEVLLREVDRAMAPAPAERSPRA